VAALRRFPCIQKEQQTFFRTLEETLGKGIGWSVSPTSLTDKRLNTGAATLKIVLITFEHVLDENAALDNFLVCVELLVV
jgi:hypothetical protein